MTDSLGHTPYMSGSWDVFFNPLSQNLNPEYAKSTDAKMWKVVHPSAAAKREKNLTSYAGRSFSNYIMPE